MTVKKAKHEIDEALLTAFETRLGRFPEDYRQFLLKNNGIELFGCAVFAVPLAEGVDYCGISEICGLPEVADLDDMEIDEEFWGWPYPKDSIPVAEDGCGNAYLMALKGERRGQIFFFDHEECGQGRAITELEFLLPSFTSLFEGVRDYEPNSPDDELLFHELIERDKRADEQFRQLLEPSKPWWKFW